ncbi:MAG TPA: hypothetical protein VIW23_15895 [Candidatus Acidoferrum sp.]|jgi:hypothetical protein
MLSDAGISLAGHTITTMQLLGVGALLLGVAAFLLAFARERSTTLKRSEVTDELAIHMGRIADMLERIANQPSERRAFRRIPRNDTANVAPLGSDSATAPSDPERREPFHVAYSMFGR